MTGGPIQEALSRRLAGAGFGDAGVTVDLAERSPFGTPAFRISVPHEDLDGSVAARRPSIRPDLVGVGALAASLDGMAEVEAVAVRPPRVYVELTAAALHDWALAGSFPPAGPGADLSHPGVQVDIDGYRTAVVAAALDGLCGTGTAQKAVVGAIEVPHGPLRARHGGIVTVDDLLGDLAVPWGDRAGAVLRFVMLRTRCARRLRLDDGRLAADGADCAAVWSALDGPGPARSGGAEPAVRQLALELERVPAVLGLAARRADPSPVIAALRALAASVTAACGRLPGGDPLLAIGAGTLGRLALLSGISGRLGQQPAARPATPETCVVPS